MAIAAKTTQQIQAKMKAAGQAAELIAAINAPNNSTVITENTQRTLKNHMGLAAATLVKAVQTTGGITLKKANGEDAYLYHALRLFLHDSDAAKDVMTATVTVA